MPLLEPVTRAAVPASTALVFTDTIDVSPSRVLL
jgi:hypothetical protein